MLVCAHLGHWYVQLAFAVPALAILGYMARDALARAAQPPITLIGGAHARPRRRVHAPAGAGVHARRPADLTYI